jgi:hypothetical protein
MKYILYIFLSLFSAVYGQTNLIKAGDFSDTTAWQLGIYSNAVAHGSITNGGYLISIDNPGTDVWSVQFTQNHLKIDSGSIYRFSFEASSTKPRTIQASICMNGGSYFPYSGRDTLPLSSTPKLFECMFLMDQHSDTSARVEFNCGAYAGNILFNNIKLVKLSGPILHLNSPEPGARYFEGYPVEIKWISSENQNPVKIELSTNNGFNWNDIISSTPNNGSYLWNPSGIYSPWCLIRISSVGNEKLSDTNDAPFAIDPQTEMIRNGTFTDDISGWNLGVNGGKASVSVFEKTCKIKIDSVGSEKWQPQFTQAGLQIQKTVTYVLSFVASAEKACSISVEINRNGGSYQTYSDSTHSIVNLTNQPQLFTTEFTANDTCSDARLDFNCGFANTTITLDNISLTKKYVSGVKTRFKTILRSTTSPVKILSLGSGHNTILSEGKMTGHSIINLMGRKVCAGSNLPQKNRGMAQGIYLSMPPEMLK